MLIVVLFDLLYAIFAFLYYLFGGTDPSGHPYIYEIIDFEANFGISVLYALAVMILNVLIHFGLVKIKKLIIRRKCTRKTQSEMDMTSPMSPVKNKPTEDVISANL